MGRSRASSCSYECLCDAVGARVAPDREQVSCLAQGALVEGPLAGV